MCMIGVFVKVIKTAIHAADAITGCPEAKEKGRIPHTGHTDL